MLDNVIREIRLAARANFSKNRWMALEAENTSLRLRFEALEKRLAELEQAYNDNWFVENTL